MQMPLTREVAHDKAYMHCNTLIHSTEYILRPCGNKVLVWRKHKNTELKIQYDPNCIKLGIEATHQKETHPNGKDDCIRVVELRIFSFFTYYSVFH